MMVYCAAPLVAAAAVAEAVVPFSVAVWIQVGRGRDPRTLFLRPFSPPSYSTGIYE